MRLPDTGKELQWIILRIATQDILQSILLMNSKGRANKVEDVSAIVDQTVASTLAAQASANEDLSQFLLGEQVTLSRRMDDVQRTKEGIPSHIGTEGTALSTIETQSHTIAQLQQELTLA